MELMKKIGSCLFLFILCFGLVSCAYAGDVGVGKDTNNDKNNNQVSAGMQNTGMHYFSFALLTILSLLGVTVLREILTFPEEVRGENNES